MPRGGANLNEFLLNVAQSMTNVGYRNDRFVPFLQGLLSRKQIYTTFLSAETPPGQLMVALDVAVLCGPPGNGTLVALTARRSGSVDWSLVSLRNCVSVGVSAVQGMHVLTIVFNGVGNLQIATASADEPDLNSFAQDVANRAWGH